MTDFHAKFFAYELTRRCSSGSIEKLTAVLADAVGLGKTIEAGLLLAQKWAERRRCPI